MTFRSRLPAEAITALGVVRRALALMPKDTAEDCIEVDLEVAGICELLAEETEGCDSHGKLLDVASDLVGLAEKTRESLAIAEADEAERRRAA